MMFFVAAACRVEKYKRARIGSSLVLNVELNIELRYRRVHPNARERTRTHEVTSQDHHGATHRHPPYPSQPLIPGLLCLGVARGVCKNEFTATTFRHL